ncbi:hypothetical protein [Arthrobacter rhombi]|uniref:hypothetical protein n=1 Tax=Arthrobacter rhombi TaxID=71253 RepID=UPI003FD17038
MRSSTRKKTSLLSAGAVISLAAGLIAAPAATAAPRPVDVTGFTVKDMVFSKPGCKSNTVTARIKTSKTVEDFEADAIVTRNGYWEDLLFFDKSSKSERMLLCHGQGLGAYKVGPTDVYGATTTSWFDFTDRTTKTFYVRGKAKAGISTARKGKYVTVKVSAKYYNPNAYGYSSFSPKSVKIQRKTTGGWKTIKTVNLKKGKASYRSYRSSKASYRAVVPQYSKTTSAVSATSRR